MSLELIQQQAVKTYNENVAYFKEHHPKLYQNLVFFETALNEKHIQSKYDLQWKENYFEIIGLEQNIPFYGKNSLELSKSMVDNSPLFDATKNSFKTYYDVNYNDEVAQIGLNSDILVKYTLSNAPIIHYVNKNLPKEQLLTEIHKFIIFGVGLGLHISYIHQQIQAKMYCIVEPNLEIFRLSLFVTNYAQLAKQSKLFLCVAQGEVEFRETFNKFYAESFILNHYLKFFQFGQGHDLYIKAIQNFLVSQPHYLYSYDRTFLSLLRTHSYISQGYQTLNLNQDHKLSLFEKPILYLAAGPSLQRNIEFVKKNQNKFIIVAIYATLPLLEKHNIKPNIVTQYDEQDYQVLNTLEKINNISFFRESIFIFSSHINAKLISTFPKNNIFIFQAMFELKQKFGMLTSPSIGELTYGLLLKLGAKNIYILGLDLAMDVETNQTHIDGHTGSKVFSQLKNLEDSDDINYSYRKNTILVKGNFLPQVKSIPVFKTNIDSFGVLTKQFKPQDCNVYNLSNGAHLEGAVPQKIKELRLNTFEEKVEDTHDAIHDTLSKVSEINYNKNDIESINLKISGAKKIKKVLEQFFKTKNYKSLEEYKNKFIVMLSDILFNKYNCDDLQQILINYSSHVIHHLFYLFSMQSITEYKKHFYELNKILNIQLNKIINTYVISISYSKENTTNVRKLNKFIKEYSIKSTSYSEPQFKELVETSLKEEQFDVGENTIGFFAIDANLSNVDFIQYIKSLLEKFPTISLKLFYFYEYQKILAKKTFKDFIDKTELIIPLTIQEIAQRVELWFETSDHTTNLKKVNDILLNNFSNLYSVYFTNSLYADYLNDPGSQKVSLPSFSLQNEVNKNYFIPNDDYYTFCNNLKSSTFHDKIQLSHLKKHIGFFSFEENLTKEFVEYILNIFNQFPQLKFVAFYFNEKQKQLFQKQFSNLLSRFIFIKPKDIYDIANTIEIFISANIKNKSFLFYKVEKELSNTHYIYTTSLTEENNIKEDKNYMASIVKDYNELSYYKSLIMPFDNNLEKRYCSNTISFLGTQSNLKDVQFIDYIKSIQINSSKYKPSINLFIFNEEDKEQLEKSFPDWNILLISSINDVIENSEYLIINASDFKDETTTFIIEHTKNIFIYIFNPNNKASPTIEDNPKAQQYLKELGFTNNDIVDSDYSLKWCLWKNYFPIEDKELALNLSIKEWSDKILKLCYENKEAKKHAINSLKQFYKSYGWIK